MTFKRMQKLTMRVFLLGKSGFEDMEQVYRELHAKLKEIRSSHISPNNKDMREESWEGVKLIDPKIKPEDRWTEYKMLFPVNFYEDKINQQIMGKKMKEWYLRPHHLETVTEHPKSIKDNMLNPKYFSQLNNEELGEFEESFEQWKERKGCKFKMTAKENDIRRNIFKTDKLIRNIQNARTILQNRNKYLGHVPLPTNHVDGLDSQVKNEVYNTVFDNNKEDLEMQDTKKKKDDSKDITDFEVTVYENMLDVLRSNELAILNMKRAEEVRRMQVSDPHWYELKNKTFYEELKRNRIRNNADDDTEKRIQKLMDETLY
jgi:hypothetical protein